MLKKTELLSAASLSAWFALVSPACAAQTPPAPSQDTSISNNVGAPALASQANNGLEDIIVTAQRREERALRVPISITTITARALQAQGTTSIANLSQAVPGLQINRSLNSATPFLRGVGNPSGAAGEEGATGIYIDGIYSTSQYANMFELNDIERIEVLKGPQGTLFGRNSAAGAILITTRTPKHELGADASIGYSNYNTLVGNAYVTGGVTETIAASLSFQGRRQGDGYGQNITTGTDNAKLGYWTLRGKALWDVDSRTRVTIAGDYYRQKEHLIGHPINRSILGFGDPGFYNASANVDSSSDMYNWGASLRIEHDADPFRVISLTGYRKTRSYGVFDFDGTPFGLISFEPIVPKDKAIQQEFQLQSNASSRLKWVAGVFLLHDDAAYDPYITRGLGTVATANDTVRRDVRQKTNSAAGFAQVTFPIIARTNLTLGGRYSIDDRQLDYTQTSTNARQNLGRRGPIKASYSSTTWRVSLDHQFTDDIMAYASVNRGFKAGLFNLNTPTDAPVRPETVTAYEVGAKARFLDNKVQISIAGFHTDFKDIQLRSVKATGGTSLLNAATARINGAEASLDVAPARGLSLSASASVLDTKFTDFPNAPATIPLPATALAGNVCPAASSGPATGGNLSCTINATGNHLLQAPPFSANFGFTYELGVGTNTLVFAGAYSYTSHFWWEPDNRLTEPSHSNINGSVLFKVHGDRWSVRLWGRNLTNIKRNGLLNSSALGDYTTPGGEPRTYGVTLSTRLGG